MFCFLVIAIEGIVIVNIVPVIEITILVNEIGIESGKGNVLVTGTESVGAGTDFHPKNRDEIFCIQWGKIFKVELDFYCP